MTFFKIDLSTINAGLSHQKSNFCALISYCYKNNLRLIKPIFKLIGKHNNGRQLQSDLSEYYDLDNIKVNGKHFDLYDDINNIKYTVGRKHYEGQLVRLDKPFSDLPQVTIEIPYRPQIYAISRWIAHQLGNNYMCIHVRRGDRITNRQIDEDTRPQNIRKVINKYSKKVVYIMTNRIDEVKSLSRIPTHRVHFYTDFKYLRGIKNNYYLFCIENVIMDLSRIRCSTFNTPRKDYYHCYLTNHGGVQ